MTPISRRLFLAMTSAMVPSAAFAHHGWSGYDTDKAFELTGEIQQSVFENPHCEIAVEADGKLWHFVLAPPSRMTRRGITPEMIAVGKTCTVYGYPHKSKPDEARIEYIVLDDKRIELR